MWSIRVLDSRRRRGTAGPYGRYAERAGTANMTLTLPRDDPPGPDPADQPPPDGERSN